MERRRWLGSWQNSWRPKPCMGIMRPCGTLKTSDGLNPSYSRSTSASCKRHPELASSPICPLRGCAQILHKFVVSKMQRHFWR